MHIKVDDLAGPEIYALLQEHLAGMRALSPPESVHALDLAALRQPGITFWTVWESSDLMACGALKELDATHGELKSMRTSAKHLRKGVAKALLQHIISEAQSRGYTRLSLETGSMAGFEPARKMYSDFGFTVCPPFAGYAVDPFSVCMTQEL